MRTEFKRIFTFLALLALTACSIENEVTPPNSEKGDAISFGSVATRVDSAAEIDEFSVWATVSSVGSTAVSYYPLLENERVYREYDGSNTWVYDNVQHWLPNSIFHFFAAYPYDLGFEQWRQEIYDQMYTGYMLKVTADGTADTEDILTAQNVTDTTVEGYATTVPLTFSHLLTKFNLTISQNTDIDSDFEYYVTKVTITGLSSDAVLFVMPLQQNVLSNWNFDNATPLTLSQNYESDPVCLREDYGSGRKSKPLKVWGEDGIMLIPHNITANGVNGVQIRVDYLYDQNPNDSDLGQAKYVEGYIPAIQWQSNTSINYNIAIANTSFISFEQPTIEPWGAPQTGGTIIIK